MTLRPQGNARLRGEHGEAPFQSFNIEVALFGELLIENGMMEMVLGGQADNTENT